MYARLNDGGCGPCGVSVTQWSMYDHFVQATSTPSLFLLISCKSSRAWVASTSTSGGWAASAELIALPLKDRLGVVGTDVLERPDQHAAGGSDPPDQPAGHPAGDLGG